MSELLRSELLLPAVGSISPKLIESKSDLQESTFIYATDKTVGGVAMELYLRDTWGRTDEDSPYYSFLWPTELTAREVFLVGLNLADAEQAEDIYFWASTKKYDTDDSPQSTRSQLIPLAKDLDASDDLYLLRLEYPDMTAAWDNTEIRGERRPTCAAISYVDPAERFIKAFAEATAAPQVQAAMPRLIDGMSQIFQEYATMTITK